jgi:hypothetical protein
VGTIEDICKRQLRSCTGRRLEPAESEDLKRQRDEAVLSFEYSCIDLFRTVGGREAMGLLGRVATLSTYSTGTSFLIPDMIARRNFLDKILVGATEKTVTVSGKPPGQ